MGIKTYNDIASMQNNPSATGSTGATRGKPKTATGGRIKVAKGGRVRKQSGSVTSVRGRGGPNIRPNVNVLGVEAARAHQAVRRANPPRETITGAGGITGRQGTTPTTGRQTPSTRSTSQVTRATGRPGYTAPSGTAQGREPRKPPPKVRPGYKKGGRISKAKGGKAKR